MARPTTATQDTALAALNQATFFRVKVENSSAAMVDLTALGGVDWVDACSVSANMNDPVGEATVTLKREVDGVSIAPLLSGSSLNDPGPLIADGRDMQIEVAHMIAGATPSSGDWVLLFKGKIDRIQFGPGGALTFTARDQLGVLHDVLIEDDNFYGDDDTPVATATVQRAILDHQFGADVFPLTIRGTPDFGVTRYPLARVRVLEALRALGELQGWNHHVLWDASASDLRPTYYAPRVAYTTPDHTLTADDYYSVEALEIDPFRVRNAGEIVYLDADGDIQTVLIERGGSADATTRRFIRLDETTSPIRTSVQATAMLNAVLDDLEVPGATQRISASFRWNLELGDWVRYNANGVHYDTNQNWATFGYTHVLNASSCRTIIEARGKPSGGWAQWLARRQGPVRNPRLTLTEISVDTDALAEVKVAARLGSNGTGPLRYQFEVTEQGNDTPVVAFAALEAFTDPPVDGLYTETIEVTRASSVTRTITVRVVDGGGLEAVASRAIVETPIALFGVRELSRTTTHVTYGWTRSTPTAAVWVYDNLVAVPQAGDAWPGASEFPDALLGTGVDTYALEIPPAGFARFVQLEPRSATGQAGAVWRLILTAEGLGAAISLSKTLEEEDRTEGLGRLGVTVFDPDGVATRLRVRKKEGAANWSALSTVTETPADATEYVQTVPLREKHLSFIEFWLEFTVDAKAGVVIAMSGGFDAGEIPDIVVKGHVEQTGQVFAQVSGDIDTKSVKVLAWKAGSEPVDIPAAVRAATPADGREVTTANLLAAPLVRGEVANVYAFGYSAVTGGGLESSELARDSVELREVTGAYLEVVTEQEDRSVTPNVGTFRVRVKDPEGVATLLRAKTKEVSVAGDVSAVSAWETVASDPATDSEHTRTVPLRTKHGSQVVFELRSSIAGELVSFMLPSSVFDLGVVPDIVVRVVIDQAGNGTLEWSGDFDTAAIKWLAWLNDDAPAGDLFAAVNTTGTLQTTRAGSVSAGVQAVDTGDTIHVAGIGYSETAPDADTYRGELERAKAVYVRGGAPLDTIKILSLEWQPDTGESGGDTFTTEGAGLNRIARIVVNVPDVGIDSLRVNFGPRTTPTGTPVEGAYWLVFDGPGVYQAVLFAQNDAAQLTATAAQGFPGAYDADTLVSVAAYTNATATDPSQSFDRAILRVSDPLYFNRVVSGSTVVTGQALRVGPGLALSTVNSMPQIGLPSGAMAVQFGGTGRDTLTAGSVLVGAGTDQVGLVAVGSNEQVLKVVAGAWVAGDVTTGVTSIVAGSAIDANATGAVTINVKPYDGIAAGYGQTSIQSDQLAVVLGTTGNSAAAGNHTHDGTYVPVARTISTTGPLTGGGDLSANRTIALTVPLAVQYGGTGRDILTSGSLVVGAGTDQVALIAPGTNGQILKVVTGAWAVGDAPAAVTSISGGAGIAITGTSSVPIVSLEGQALALHNLNSNGIMVRTGADTFATRSLDSGAGITISTADGISAAPQIALAGQALALHNLATAGLVVRTGADTFATRSVAAGNGLTSSNGDGVAGNPTLNIDTPGSLTATTTNSASGNHTHALDGDIGRITVSGAAPSGTPSRAGDVHFVV